MRAGMTRMLAIGVAAALAAGCEALPRVLQDGDAAPERAPSPTAEPAPDDAARGPEVARVPPPATADGMRPEATPTRVEPPVPPRRPAIAPIEFARLKGLTPGDARALLGAPDGRGETPPATVWTYRQGPCRLKLFFYYDLTKKTERTLTVELDPGSEAAGARAACLVELARRGAGHDGGAPVGAGSATAS